MNFITSLILSMTLLICSIFSEQTISFHTIPEDCPFISGLDRKSDGLNLAIHLGEECSFKIRQKNTFVREFYFVWDFPDNRSYRMKITENDNPISNDIILRKNGHYSIKNHDDSYNAKTALLSSDSPSGVVLFEFYRGWSPRPKKIAFIPFCLISSSSIDKAMIYFSDTVPASRAILFHGENFEPNEPVEIAYRYGNNYSQSFKETAFANEKGNIFSKTYLKGRKPGDCRIKILLQRKKNNELIFLEN